MTSEPGAGKERPPMTKAANHPEAAPPSLVVDGVSHSFGDKQVLDNVSLKVEQGQFAVLL